RPATSARARARRRRRCRQRPGRRSRADRPGRWSGAAETDAWPDSRQDCMTMQELRCRRMLMQAREPPHALAALRAGPSRATPPATEPALQKVVLAYSGGLDTSVAVAWLQEQYEVEVVTLTVDVGGGSLRPGAAERALSAGATRAYVVDARKTFVEDFVLPALRAGALYGGAYPLRTA